MTKLDRVMAPKQERSAQSLQRIVHALEVLLESKSFNEITMSDIEAQSQCGIATIYARFKDKNSILAALHESIRGKTIAAIEKSTAPERWKNRSSEEALRSILRGIVTYYAENRHLLRAILLLNDREVYDRATSTIEYASQRLQNILLASRCDASPEMRRNAGLGLKAAYSLLHERLLFVPDSDQTRDLKRFADDLSRLVMLTFAKSPRA